MESVEEHRHSFLPGNWPFAEPTNTLSYTSASVLGGQFPILLVFHDHDGEWQFLHGEVEEQHECKIICLGCIYERDSSIGSLSDLPAGWMAFRDSVGASWQREPYEAHER